MANVGTHKHKTTELYGLPTDWLLTIPRGIPPPTWWWGDKCGPAGTALFGDGRRPTAAAAAAATAAAAAATEELGGGGGEPEQRQQRRLLQRLTDRRRLCCPSWLYCGGHRAAWCCVPDDAVRLYNSRHLILDCISILFIFW